MIFYSFNLNLYFRFLMHLLLVSQFEYFFKKGKQYLNVHFVSEIFWWAECMQFLKSCVFLSTYYSIKGLAYYAWFPRG